MQVLNKPYLSIQELLDKTAEQRRAIRKCMDRAEWHPEDASILDGQNSQDRYMIQETLRNLV